MHGVRCFRRDRADAQIRRWARLYDGARFGQAVQYKGLTLANLFHARLVIETVIGLRTIAHTQFVLLCPQRIAIDDDTATAQSLSVAQVVANLRQTLQYGFAFMCLITPCDSNRWIEA